MNELMIAHQPGERPNSKLGGSTEKKRGNVPRVLSTQRGGDDAKGLEKGDKPN